MERAIVLPFSIDDSGSILSSNDQRVIWQSRVTAAVMTEIGERVFRPQYGGTLKESLFQNEAEAIKTATDSVTAVFSTFLKALVLKNVSAIMNEQEGTLSLTISYTLPNKENGQVSLKTGTLNRSGDVIQEY